MIENKNSREVILSHKELNDIKKWLWGEEKYYNILCMGKYVLM